MKIQQLKDQIRLILPEAQFEEDNYGQILIYTNLMIGVGDGEAELIPFECDDETLDSST
jgi:hypothetical protein